MTDNNTSEHFRILLGIENVPKIQVQSPQEVLMAANIQQGSPSHMMNGYPDVRSPSFPLKPATNSKKY